MMRPMRLDAVVRALKKKYGRVVQKKAGDPWELVLLENVGYLVSDERRAVAFRALKMVRLGWIKKCPKKGVK